jgi:hypothetical protein
MTTRLGWLVLFLLGCCLLTGLLSSQAEHMSKPAPPAVTPSPAPAPAEPYTVPPMGKASRCREKVVLKHLLGPMEPLSAILYPLRRRVSRPLGAALHLRRALVGATKALVQKCLLNFHLHRILPLPWNRTPIPPCPSRRSFCWGWLHVFHLAFLLTIRYN